MNNTKRAFTLIELLVVIAIIAILAAILFPVFTRAKESAKITVALSNMKQIGTSWWMYQSDNDDMFSPRRILVGTGANQGELSWKQLLHPYIKSTDIFKDPINPASKYADDTSDVGYRASLGQVVIGPKMVRGYTMYDQAFFVNGSFGSLSFSPGQIEEPSNVIAIMEQKMPWVDGGPWLNWSTTQSDPILGGQIGKLGYPWGGKKWDEKAMINVYIDGHAKRATTGAICGQPDSLNQWNYVKNKLVTGYFTDLNWMDTYCSTRPAAVR